MTAHRNHEDILVKRVDRRSELPIWAREDHIVNFLHNAMKPYEDTIGDIQHGLNYAFSTEAGKGGFLLLARLDRQLSGVLVMLNTGMRGYIPENLLLFVAVAPEARRMGIGQDLVMWAIDECDGDVSLHVEYDNPAKRLYERIGFTSKYAEMRYSK